MPRAPRATRGVVPSSPYSSSSTATSVETYSDAEEALEAGVESEERGERLAYGLKARKAYERAFELYDLSSRMGFVGADATYNGARVLYVLASSFYMPSEAFEALQQSIRLYRLAAGRVAGSGGASPSDFALDIAYNLAMAMQSLIELGTDLPGASAGAGALGTQDLVQLTREAVLLLKDVAREQEVVLSAQLDDERLQLGISGRDNGNDVQAQAQASLPRAGSSSTGGEDDGTSTSSPPLPGATTTSSEYTSSLIVPCSLLDGYVSSVSLLINLCSLCTNTSEIQSIQSELEDILSKAREFISQCDAANSWGHRASPDDDWERCVSELDKCTTEARVATLSALIRIDIPAEGGASSMDTCGSHTHDAFEKYAPQVISLAQDHLQVVQSMSKSKEALAQHVTTTVPESRRRAFWQIKVDEMVDASDRGVELARLLLRYAAAAAADSTSSSSSSSALRLAWSLGTTCSTLYLLILSLLDTTTSTSTGSAAVLGSSHSATTTTLLRCQVLTCLSDVSLFRLNPLFTTLSAPPVVNDKSRSVIADNARVYAKRALNEVGLSWVVDGAAANANPQMVMVNKKRTEIPPGGWDAIQTQAEAILTLVRASFFRGRFYESFTTDSQELQAKTQAVKETASTELSIVSKRIKSLMLNPAGGGGGSAADTAAAHLADAWNLALDTTRWVEALLEEEGEEMIDIDERAFWSQWSAQGHSQSQ